ncbi:MAG TPA: hypothetical protein DHU55_13920 [Blastocatellia bacterium]|jgi:hypothetical protein|nr:hypothetical protein [Blastocatellia bacterium]HAF23443.1 hypothetical protein [Blastocatellia bacterium]HCX30843.1 hypothetical protein [Blastocatellia bacterium]
MTKARIVLVTLLCFVFPLAGCTKPAGTPSPAPGASPANPTEGKHVASVDVVKATAAPTEISPGSSAEAIIHLTIQHGYHINANPPTYSYLKATELEIPTGDGVTAGLISYPAPLQRKFAFAEKPLAVYEGETELRAHLKADKAAKQGEQSISAKLRIQACDEQVCYPPGILEVAIPVSIK